MIKKKPTSSGVQVTFSLETDEPASLVADVNGWDPYAHPLKKRSNGARSVALTMPAGSVIRFRYLDASGRFFDDPDGDAIEPNGYGETHTVLSV